jgi:hypothetical protein
MKKLTRDRVVLPFPQEFPADLGDYGLGYTFLPEMSKQQQNPSQSLFAGIKKVID